MMGVLLVTHSFLGKAFIQITEQVLGPQENFKFLDINGDFDHEQKLQEFSFIVNSMDQGNGVLVLTDLFGGISSSIAIAGLSLFSIEVVSGLNLAMVFKTLNQRSRTTLSTLALMVQEEGKNDIRIASSILEEPPSLSSSQETFTVPLQ